MSSLAPPISGPLAQPIPSAPTLPAPALVAPQRKITAEAPPKAASEPAVSASPREVTSKAAPESSPKPPSPVQQRHATAEAASEAASHPSTPAPLTATAPVAGLDSVYDGAGKQEWYHGKSHECCSGTCLYACCCPCFPYGRNAKHLDNYPGGPDGSCGSDCAIYWLLTHIPCGAAVLACIQRHDTREKLNIRGNGFRDFCASYFCHPCVLAQIDTNLNASKAVRPTYVASQPMVYAPMPGGIEQKVYVPAPQVPQQMAYAPVPQAPQPPSYVPTCMPQPPQPMTYAPMPQVPPKTYPAAW